MKNYLTGEKAKRTCEEILDHFYIDETYNVHLGSKGYWKEKVNDREIYVAFDNSSGDCWIEQFDNEYSTKRWLTM